MRRGSWTSRTSSRSRSSSRRPRAAIRLDLLAALTASDLRARYGRGGARLVKWLLDPFALVGVYLVLVTVVLDRGGRAPGLSLACAVVPFQLVTLAVLNAIGALAQRRSIVTNMAFERTLIPLASACTESVAFAAALLLPAGLMAVYGVAPTADLVWLPVAIALTFALAVALAYAAALFGLYFPDLRPFGVSFMRTLFFLAPGLVALEEIRGETGDWIRVNPLTGLFELWRHALLGQGAPDAWMLLVPAGVAATVLAVALPLYRRDERHFSKVLG